MFRCVVGENCAIPPEDARLTESSVSNDDFVVRFRTTLASLNRTRESVASPFHTAGSLLLSEFVAAKSRLSTSIWLFTWASETFCTSVR
jgi:hypothetical protein